MAMNLRDFLRLTVVKTNPYWPFSALNKVPYTLAIQAFLRMAGSFPELKSVYLRHGLLRKDWIPAISDIDLTLILESGLSAEQEFAFLHRFWSEFKRLKKMFPMLGEIDILREQQFDAWVNITIRGYEAKDWVLLQGDKTLPEIAARTHHDLRLDSMDHAMICYLNIFLRRLFQEGRKSPLYEYEIRRLSSRILHYIYYEEDIERRNGFLPPLDYIPALIKNFDDRLNAVTENDPKCFERKEGWERVVSSIILSHNLDVLIVKELWEVEAGFDWMVVTQPIPKGRKRPPVIVSKKMFEYMLRFYDPFLHSQMSEFAKLTYGKHPARDVSAPEISSFIRCILRQTPNLLAFPQTMALITPHLCFPDSERALDSMLEHALLIKLYLEKGLIGARYGELISATQQHFPEYYEELSAIKQNPSRTEHFRFWKAIAQEIYQLKPHKVGDYRGKIE